MSEALVWRLVPERATDEEVAAARALLAPEEREKADAFAREVDRRRSALVRAALRRAVGGALGLDPARVRLATGPRGKPLVADDPGLHVNASHTDALALVALSRAGPVGVDVERRRGDVEALDLARRYFAPAEAARLAALPAGERAGAFLRLWTRKEALLKAAGQGLGGGLDVATGDGPGWAAVDAPGLGAFWVSDLEVGAGHVAALAVGREACAAPLVVWVSP
ncbi:MAG: 4'-phosphopantetheinyl transferase superfamily protein [Planctomycetes bacterium]|nr:4'-phosphopantetheinyl transferase superfamily protein [Planctomycetota bacterium]